MCNANNNLNPEEVFLGTNIDYNSASCWGLRVSTAGNEVGVRRLIYLSLKYLVVLVYSSAARTATSKVRPGTLV